MRQVRIESLGPGITFCRLHHFRSSGGLSLPELGHHPIVNAYLELREVGAFERMPKKVSWDPLSVELTWVAPVEFDDDYRWEMFRRRLRKAALAAGFSQNCSAALAGAFGEMASNAQEHSGRVHSAMAGYSWRPGVFEYVVSDLGVGVLESLRSCGHHGDARSHAAALDLAVQPGVSKTGTSSGRGFGFREMIRSLSKLYSDIRVHSGDHCVDISGAASSLADRVLRETFEWPGFTVSVACRPAS